MSNQYKSKAIFWLYKSKANKNNEVPIYLRIIVGSNKTELATGIFIKEKDWDGKYGRVRDKINGSELINTKLDSLLKGYSASLLALLKTGEEFTAADLKCHITGAKTDNNTLLDIIKIHNERANKLKGIDYTPATVERYNTVFKLIQLFLKAKHNVNDYPLSKLNNKFLGDFLDFLKTERQNGNNTAVKYCVNLKTILNYARFNGYIDKNPFDGFRFTLKPVNTVFLTEGELKSMEEKYFGIERLESVKRIFLFQCYTGLAYADIKKLNKNELVEMMGRKWIYTTRTKSKIPVRVPLIRKAENLLSGLINETSVAIFNVPTNQKMNAYLKEIADLCRINKRLCTHTARRTFATTITLSQGISISSVSAMLGHTNLKTTQIYAKVVPQKILSEMAKIDL